MEIFKTIKGYPLYSISTEGQIRKNSTGKIMKPSKKPNGYMSINLFMSDGRRRKELVHRLVALTFIENPNHLPQVNHIDRVRDNNCVDNLEWVTIAENVAKSSAPKPIMVKKKNDTEWLNFPSIRAACLALDLSEPNVSMCISNRQRTHRGYVVKLQPNRTN